MPNSCKSILDKMVYKGAMTEQERDKILRNLRPQEQEENEINDEVRFPGWDVDGITKMFRQILETNHMWFLDLHFHAEVNDVPQMSYTIKRHVMPKFDKGKEEDKS